VNARLVIGLCALLSVAADWAPECDTEWAYRWCRPDQPRDSKLDEPEHHPRLPHTRGPDAGRQRGYPPRCDEERRRRELAQWLSPADDPVGFRGVCVLHHSGPPCRGDPTPLPRWVPDSPDEPWTQNVLHIPGSWRR
jgi:hypothetical protein